MLRLVVETWDEENVDWRLLGDYESAERLRQAVREEHKTIWHGHLHVIDEDKVFRSYPEWVQAQNGFNITVWVDGMTDYVCLKTVNTAKEVVEYRKKSLMGFESSDIRITPVGGDYLDGMGYVGWLQDLVVRGAL